MFIAEVLFAATAAVNPTPPPGVRVTGTGYDGFIVAPVKDQQFQGWQPTPQQIKELETALSSYVADELRRQRVKSLPKPLSEYKRQYWGVYTHKTFYVYVHLYHQSTDLVRTGQWTRGMVSVSGGGYLFYRARYDASHKVIEFFRQNAPE